MGDGDGVIYPLDLFSPLDWEKSLFEGVSIKGYLFFGIPSNKNQKNNNELDTPDFDK